MMPGRRMCSEVCRSRKHHDRSLYTLPSPNAVPLSTFSDPDTTLCPLSDRNGRIMICGIVDPGISFFIVQLCGDGEPKGVGLITDVVLGPNPSISPALRRGTETSPSSTQGG